MAAKNKSAGNPKKLSIPDCKKYPRKTVPVFAGKTEEETGLNFAGLATSPEFAAYRVINGVEKKGGIGEHIDAPTMLEELRGQAAAANSGDLAQAEAMLMNQATALQSLFSRLAERGMSCDQAAAFEANMRIALRAQAQGRATLETLAAIKNPPIVYARQANIANGPQQVNNGTAAPSRARENEIEPSKLSGANHELPQNEGTQALTGGVNKEVEAVGAIYGAKNGRG